jgi:chromosome segregation ATPase
MAKKSFSVGRTNNGVLNSAGGDKLKELQANAQYNFQFIAKDRIISNPKNEKYTQDGIESLKESIIENGLRHNLSVLFDAEQNNYRLISGERRYHAICAMSDKEYNELFPTGIPCKVEKSDISEIDEEIMLISANHDVRETSMEVKRWEVSRLKELYEAKKLKGEIKNINAEIAHQLNISERQARKYTTAEKLIPELSNLLNENGIDLNQADKFGKLDESAQQDILKIIHKKGEVENSEFQTIKKLSEEREKEAKKYKEEYEKASKQIEEKDLTVKKLQQRLTELENKDNHIVRSRQDLEDEIRFLTDAKEQAEKEKHKLETNLEKIKQQQKDKERKNTSISDSELKRISSIAKTEQALNLLENNFDVLKNNKQTLQHDPDLKIRVELLKRRMDDLLVSINE